MSEPIGGGRISRGGMLAVAAPPVDDVVTVARTVGDIQPLRTTWTALQGDAISADPEAFLDGLREDHGIRPHVVVLRRSGEPRAMLIAYERGLRFAYKLGYKWLHTPALRGITVVYRGTLGDMSEGAAEALLAELERSAQRGDADVVHFTRLTPDSPVYRIATERTSFQHRRLRRPVTRWELSLPPSFEEFLGSLSRTTRGSVRKYSNRLERELGRDLELRTFRDLGDFDQLAGDMRYVAERSWQGDVGVGFRNREEELRQIARGLERGTFRACVLFVRGRPAAYWCGEACGDRFYTGTTGYDRQYGDYRVGTYVLMRLIEDLCADEAISVIDFGLGDAEYKRRFGTHRWYEQDVILFTGRPRATAIALLVSSLESVQLGLDSLLRRPRVKRLLKRAWRAAARVRGNRR